MSFAGNLLARILRSSHTEKSLHWFAMIPSQFCVPRRQWCSAGSDRVAGGTGQVPVG